MILSVHLCSEHAVLSQAIRRHPEEATDVCNQVTITHVIQSPVLWGEGNVQPRKSTLLAHTLSRAYLPDYNLDGSAEQIIYHHATVTSHLQWEVRDNPTKHQTGWSVTISKMIHSARLARSQGASATLGNPLVPGEGWAVCAKQVFV